jgi:hypothetical protein
MHKVSPIRVGLLSVASIALLASCGLQVTDYPLANGPFPGSEQGGSSGSSSGTGTGGVSGGNNTGGVSGGNNTGGVNGGNNTGGVSGGNNTGGSGGGGNTANGGTGGGTNTGGNPGTNTGGSGGGEPPSGVTVDIGGMKVPKEKAIAFIHFGHSNMAGRAKAPQTLVPWFFTDVNPRAWMFHAAGTQAGFKPAKEPFSAGDGTTLSQNAAGPGTALVKQAAERGQDDYQFISVGFAQNALRCSEYAVGTRNYEAALAGPRALKGKVTWGAIVIMLGITERHGVESDYPKYPTCINAIVASIRKEIGDPNVPLLLTDYEMTARNSSGEDLTADGPYGRKIIPHIHAVPTFLSKMHPINKDPKPDGKGAVMNSALVPTEGLSLIDDHHFQLDAQKKWTSDLLDIMKEAGWAPWLK